MAKRGRKPLPFGKKRVHLHASIAFATNESLLSWEHAYGVKTGHIIDDMIAFCRDNPAFKLELRPRKTKKRLAGLPEHSVAL